VRAGEEWENGTLPRTAALDVGERRIGVAVSDPSGSLARPLGVLRATGLDGNALEVTAAEIGRLANEADGLDAIVIGLPCGLDGAPTPMTRRIEVFGARLAARTGLPIAFQDERLTSAEAESRLALRERRWRARKERLDAAAAAIILQDYLDTHPARPATAVGEADDR
jgi:putative Holliday junction resolvase